ncbi:MAG TPA: hypothetical protein VMY76_03775 [Gemmatimonadales bacterium]|nr:hypothetical protein [Gemmatimonadales bacterium]
MLRISLVALATLGTIGAAWRLQASHTVPGVVAADTIQAGDPRIDASRLRPFALERHLTLTRGDTIRPFGRQSESLEPATLGGRPVLLGVLTFETPNATTVDSSWMDAATLRPIRMQSSNRARVVALEFEDDHVRGATTPSAGMPAAIDQRLGVRPFEWNMFGLAVSALPLRPGYRATMPVYMDRFNRVVWYDVHVVGDTTLVRTSGFRAPMWEVVATADSTAPSARFWVSQRHRFVDRVRVWEPGVAIMYERRL